MQFLGILFVSWLEWPAVQEQIEANVVAYNAAISACQCASDFAQVRTLLEEMQHLEVRANVICVKFSPIRFTCFLLSFSLSV